MNRCPICAEPAVLCVDDAGNQNWIISHSPDCPLFNQTPPLNPM